MGDHFFSYSLAVTDEFYEKMPQFNILNEEEIKLQYLDYLKEEHKGVRESVLGLVDNFLFDNNELNLYILAFFRFYIGFDTGLSKYVSHLHQILIYLDQTVTLNSDMDLTNYPEFLKAQLSNDEKFVIWLCMKIENKDISLLYKYGIFKGMRPRVSLEELKKYC